MRLVERHVPPPVARSNGSCPGRGVPLPGRARRHLGPSHGNVGRSRNARPGPSRAHACHPRLCGGAACNLGTALRGGEDPALRRQRWSGRRLATHSACSRGSSMARWVRTRRRSSTLLRRPRGSRALRQLPRRPAPLDRRRRRRGSPRRRPRHRRPGEPRAPEHLRLGCPRTRSRATGDSASSTPSTLPPEISPASPASASLPACSRITRLTMGGGRSG